MTGGEEEDTGKGCFWIMAGAGLFIFLFLAGSALVNLTN